MEGAVDALYLFAILPTGAVASLPSEMPSGFDGHRTIEALKFPELDLVALVEPTERLLWIGEDAEEKLQDVQWVAPRAMLHDKIVHWAYDHTGALYPTNLATIFSDADTLEESLAWRVGELGEYFSKTEDADQFSLKALIDGRGDRPVDSVQCATGGGDYLRRRARSGAGGPSQEALRDDARALLDALRPFAREETIAQGRASKDQGKHRLFAWHFLIPRGDRPGFEERLDQLAPTLSPQLELELAGPLPPYQFR